MIGECIAQRYDVLRLLGKGGMGEVYEAHDRRTSRSVALKLITDKEAIAHKNRLSRFKREARAAGRADSEHIVQVFDCDVDEESGLPYMAMELLKGEDLQQLLDRLDRLPVDLALRILAQACQGLVSAHEAGVIHRDMKPANLFLAARDDGTRVVKLLDFGIAKMAPDGFELTTGPGSLTNTGALIGSPLYMSPEQTKSSKTIDARTDVWSLGIVLYRAIVGGSPFPDDEGIGGLVLAINSDPVRVPEDACLPKSVAKLIHKAARIDREQRTQSAAALLEAITDLATTREPIREDELTEDANRARLAEPPKVAPSETVSDADTLDRAHEGIADEPEAEKPDETRPKPSGYSKTLLVAAALAVLAIGSFALLSGPEASSSAPADSSTAGRLASPQPPTQTTATETAAPTSPAPKASPPPPPVATEAAAPPASASAPPIDTAPPPPPPVQARPPKRTPPPPPPAPAPTPSIDFGL